MPGTAGLSEMRSVHHLMPSVPPPPIPSPLRREHQQPPLPPVGHVSSSTSRYRALRGKSVSSAHRNRPFDIFVDSQDVPPCPSLVPRPLAAVRRRSQSMSSQPMVPLPLSTANAAANSTPLSSKSVNLSLQPSSYSSFNLKAKFESSRPADLGRLKAITFNKTKPSPTVSRDTKPKALLIAATEYQEENEPQPSQPLPLLLPQPQPQYQHQPQQQSQQQSQQQWVQEVARLEAETDRILAEQKKRDLARLQAQLANVTPPPKPRRLILDKLTLFAKGGRSKATASSGSKISSSSTTTNSPITPPHSATSTTFPLVWSPGTTNFDGPPSLDTDFTSMAFFDYGGAAGGLSAQMDAPTSASNGGERRITVRCLSATINLPVTPDTSPADIIYSTANFITQKIDPANCVLVECYLMCGLERHLRQYEKVRDVLNSWDRDQQNSLMVVPHDYSPDVRELELAHVPRTEDPPAGFTFHLYHASRPGKWTKRWVTLAETGQMFAAKHPESKFTDKDSVTLCHLSDFDIYTPKESENSHHLKPPKRFCYAIKSQQKSNAFPNGENFVHFFSTEDSRLAHRFHELIHGWRSWYLANKRVDVDAKAAATVKKSLSISAKSHKSKSKGRLSTDEKPYMLGDFKPLIDMERFDKPIEEFGKDLPIEIPLPPPKPQPNSRTRRASGKVPPSKGAAASLPTSPVVSEGEFLSGGLLGDAYDKRKQAESVTSTGVKRVDGPFTSGPSLLNSIGGGRSVAVPEKKPEPPSWFPSATEHTARVRSVSSPRNGTLLRRPTTADSKPVPSNPPAGRAGPRPGKGRGVKPPPDGTPLIDLANGNPIPSSPVPTRSTSRAGASSGGGGGLVNQPPRRRATTTSSRSGSRPVVLGDRPPVPPLPDRSVRRQDPTTLSPPTQSRDQQSAEPLIKRAK